MKLFSQILFDTKPQPSSAVPTGKRSLSWSPTNGGALVVTDPANASTALGAAKVGTPVHGVKAVGTLTSDNTNNASGDTVTIGTKVYTFRTFKASNTLTNDATNITDGDTVTIGSKVYTFQDTLTDVDGHVKKAASATLSMTNLFNAINGTGGTAGTDYALSTVANTQVIATNPSATTVVVTAILPGTAQNAVATTEVSTHLAWAATTLGGVGATSISTGGTTEGDVNLGASADASLLNLIRAINHSGTANTDYKCAGANADVTAATAVTAHAFAVTARDAGVVGNIASTETGAHLSWGAALLVGGVDCTQAKAGEQYIDTSYLYTAHADMTTASLTGWYKSAVATL